MNSKNSLTVKLAGGLGNQLFKFCAGIKIAGEIQKNLVGDISWFKYFPRSSGVVETRDFGLAYFPNLRNFDFVQSRNPVLQKKKSQFMKRCPNVIRRQLGFFTERDFSLLENYKRAKILEGNFEDTRFLPQTEQLMHLLAFPKSKSEWLNSSYTEYKPEKSIAVHIRRRDYDRLPHIYDLLTVDYYIEAVEYLNSRLGDLPITLFSDDIPAALHWIGKSVRVTKKVEVPSSIHSGEILQLLSSFSGLVTAHSTFSWWAGKLGSINGTCREVVMPSRFLRSETKPIERLIVSGWRVIEV